MVARGNGPRNPDSRATEKHELSALKEAERAEGPALESSMGRVFMAGAELGSAVGLVLG